jgi:hypothetical protein
MLAMEEFRTALLAESSQGVQLSYQWFTTAVDFIDDQLKSRLYVVDRGNRLPRVGARWAPGPVFDHPSDRLRELVTLRYLSRGWHHVEFDSHPNSAVVWFGMMRDPVEVTLVDGSTFEAVYDPDLNSEQLARSILQHGVKRPTEEGWVYYPPHRISCTRVLI